MKKKLNELIEARRKALDKVDAILQAAETETRSLTETETTEHKKNVLEVKRLGGEITLLQERIELRDEQDKLDKVANIPTRGTPRSVTPVDNEVQGEVSRDEFRSLQRYSVAKAVREMAGMRNVTGLEAEMMEEAHNEVRGSGCEIQGNFQIPLKVLQLTGNDKSFEQWERRKELEWEKRAMTATGSSQNMGDQGGLAIQTNVGSIIERFYAKLMVRGMGATVLDGLVGNVLFPRHITDDEAAAIAENGVAPVSSSKLGSVTLQPRRIPVVLEISRQFSMQTSPAIEAYLRNDLGYQSAKIIDQYCISGIGGNNQPYGILNTAGVALLFAGASVAYNNGVPTFTFPGPLTNPNGAAMSYADSVQLEKAIAIVNADVGSLATLTNPKVRAALKLTPKVAASGAAATYPEFVWENNEVNGYRTGSTTQMPSNLTKGAGVGLSSVIFANWADALIGQWGGMDMLINPFSKDDQGIIRINAWSFFDFNIRRPQSFAVMTDVIA